MINDHTQSTNQPNSESIAAQRMKYSLVFCIVCNLAVCVISIIKLVTIVS